MVLFPLSSFLNTRMASLPSDVVLLLKALMTIESNTGNEGDVVDFLAEGLYSDGWFVTRQDAGGRGRMNIYATRVSPREHSPRLVFNSHLDTVPPHVSFSEDEDNIYGRGSCDAKGQVAAMIVAARRLVAEYPSLAKDVALLFVVGEEVDHIGMIKANDLPSLAPEFLVVGEPTEMKYATVQKGAAKIRLISHGKAGHSGYPSAGDSAVHRLIEVLGDIMKYPWPKDETLGDTTFNIGLINGGQALNAWAEKAEATIFFRVTTSYSDVKSRVESIVGGRVEMDHSLGGNEPVPLSTPAFPHHKGHAAFNTDIPYYKEYKDLKGVYLFGAGSITVAHGPNEFVPKAELRHCVDCHLQLALQLLNHN